MGNKLGKNKESKGGSSKRGWKLQVPVKLRGRTARGDSADNGYRVNEVEGGSTELIIKSVISVVNAEGTNGKVQVRENGKKEVIGDELNARPEGPGRTNTKRGGIGVTANRAGQGQGVVEPVKLKVKTTRRGNRKLDGRHGRGDGDLSRTGGEDTGLEEGGGAKVEQRGAVKGGRIAVVGRGPKVSHLTQQDYLQLIKLLGIRLPAGVLTPDVITLANMESSIQDAKAILRDLEHFRIRFKVIPRLSCREVKDCLARKRKGDVLQITNLLFFDLEDDETQHRKNWSGNKTHTGSGFRLRDGYITDTAVSTPPMYATAATRSWAKLEVGEVSPMVTKGTKVNVRDIEGREYCDESGLCGPKRFGMFHQNEDDELEMLKFFHEDEDSKTCGTRATSYTKGNNVEYGFLSGRLDFLAEMQTNNFKKKGKATDKKKCEQMIIECKSTTGDLVGKLYTKTPNSRQAVINRMHKYSYQVQTYMYILKNQKDSQVKRAVMIVRHYHQGGNPPRDIHWSYLEAEPSVQREIEELRIYCQTEVLARYLALLNLIFLRESQPSKQGLL